MAEVLHLFKGKFIELLICIDNMIMLNDDKKNKIFLSEFENEINEEDVEMKFTFDETNYAQVLKRIAKIEVSQGIAKTALVLYSSFEILFSTK